MFHGSCYVTRSERVFCWLSPPHLSEPFLLHLLFHRNLPSLRPLKRYFISFHFQVGSLQFFSFSFTGVPRSFSFLLHLNNLQLFFFYSFRFFFHIYPIRHGFSFFVFFLLRSHLSPASSCVCFSLWYALAAAKAITHLFSPTRSCFLPSTVVITLCLNVKYECITRGTLLKRRFL